MATTPQRLLRDQSYNPVQIASEFVTQDATATPQSSPLAYTDAVTTIEVPARGAEVVLRPTTQLRVSEDSTMARYFLIDAGLDTALPLGRMARFYVTRDATSGNLHFRFNLV